MNPMSERHQLMVEIQNAVGQERLALRQEIKAKTMWPKRFESWLATLELRMRMLGFDEDSLAVEDLSTALVQFVEEAIL